MKTFLVSALLVPISSHAQEDMINGANAQKMYESLNVEATVDDPTFENIKSVVKIGNRYTCTFFVNAKTPDDSYICQENK